MNEPSKELQAKIDEFDLRVKNTTEEEIVRLMHIKATSEVLDAFVHWAYTGDILKVKKNFKEWRTKNYNTLIDILYLVDAVEYVISSVFIKSRQKGSMEIDVQNEFYNNLEKYLPTAEKINVKINHLHRPDGFILYEGNILPVEVKRESVTSTTIYQIKRYIEEYKSVGGVVVAPELRTVLPSNVKFIRVIAPRNKQL